MITSLNNKALYIGVTDNLQKRTWQHKNKMFDGFTKKYKCTKLVWYEEFQYIKDAIEAEKRMKKWRRQKKDELINKTNPDWNDLSKDWYDQEDKSLPGHFDASRPPASLCLRNIASR